MVISGGGMVNSWQIMENSGRIMADEEFGWWHGEFGWVDISPLEQYDQIGVQKLPSEFTIKVHESP